MTDDMVVAHNYRKVSVSYRKAVSDGNYGTEAGEVSLEWYVKDEQSAEDDHEAAEQMLAQARSLVHQELRKSPAVRVRQAVNQPQADKTAVALGPREPDDEGDESPF